MAIEIYYINKKETSLRKSSFKILNFKVEEDEKTSKKTVKDRRKLQQKNQRTIQYSSGCEKNIKIYKNNSFKEQKQKHKHRWNSLSYVAHTSRPFTKHFTKLSRGVEFKIF